MKTNLFLCGLEKQMDYKLIDNKEISQYEIHIEGVVAKILYKRKDNKIYLIHTEVPKELAGKGVASSLAEKVLEDIRQRGLKLIPRCPFIKKYLQRHPEWEELVLKKKI